MDSFHLFRHFCLILLSGIFIPFSVLAAPPPVITAQPEDTVVVLGGTATFTVAANSGTALSYQWYKDGLLILDVKLTGETRASLVINNVSSSDEGRYFVRVSNAGGTVTSYKASLTVVPNTPPVANSDFFATSEETTLVIPAPGVLANDTDINGQVLTAALKSNVEVGELTLAQDGSFIYVPPSNFFGAVSFTYGVADDYPVEYNFVGGNKQEVKTGETDSQSFRHDGTGTYKVSKVVLYLSRKAGGSGNVNFYISTSRASGQIAGSAVSIPVSAITNTSEGSTFQAYSIVFPQPIGPFTSGTTYFLNLKNESNEKFFAEIGNPNNTYANGVFYDNGDVLNKDLRFELHKDTTSNPATVTIQVTPVNDPPVAEMDWFGAIEDTPATLTVLTNDYDVEGSPLTITGVSTTNGTAHVSGTNIVFLPATNYNGWVLLNYTISDGDKSAMGYAAVLVLGVNDAPLPSDDSYTTPEDTALIVSAPGVIANDLDPDGDALAVAVWNNVSHGTLSLNTDGSFTYVPHENYHGPDSFTYLESDGQSWSATLTTVNINVTPVNDPPVAQADHYTIAADAPLIVPAEAAANDSQLAGVLSNDSDADGDALTAVLVQNVSHGTLVLQPNGAFSYKPDTNFFGTDSFSYRASDGTTTSEITTVSLTVLEPVPQEPLTIKSIGMRQDGFHFEVSGTANSSYVIEASSDLNTWTPIWTNSNPSGPVPFVDTEAVNLPARFYRISEQ